VFLPSSPEIIASAVLKECSKWLDRIIMRLFPVTGFLDPKERKAQQILELAILPKISAFGKPTKTLKEG